MCSGESFKLGCTVYGYPHNSMPPVWTHGSDVVLNDGRHNITSSNAHLLAGGSVKSTDAVVSYLTVRGMADIQSAGKYRCSVQGNSSTYASL